MALSFSCFFAHLIVIIIYFALPPWCVTFEFRRQTNATQPILFQFHSSFDHISRLNIKQIPETKRNDLNTTFLFIFLNKTELLSLSLSFLLVKFSDCNVYVFVFIVSSFWVSFCDLCYDDQCVYSLFAYIVCFFVCVLLLLHFVSTYFQCAIRYDLSISTTKKQILCRNFIWFKW